MALRVRPLTSEALGCDVHQKNCNVFCATWWANFEDSQKVRTAWGWLCTSVSTRAVAAIQFIRLWWARVTDLK